MSGQILLKSETEIVGKDFLKLAKATLSDGVTTIGLELWEDIIDKIIEGQTYTVSNARVRIWNKKKKLSTTKDSIVQNNDDENLMKIPYDTNVVLQSCDSSIEITNIKSVQEIQKFKQCVMRFRKSFYFEMTLQLLTMRTMLSLISSFIKLVKLSCKLHYEFFRVLNY